MTATAQLDAMRPAGLCTLVTSPISLRSFPALCILRARSREP